MLFIGICGASGSGKSTLAQELQARIHRSCVLLAQDSYYFDRSDLPFAERERINYDHPEAFDHAALLADIVSLREGRPITHKRYDYVEHRRADLDDWIAPAEVVILEGIHAFFDEKLREQMNLRIFLQVDPDMCLLRRVQRDIVERGRSIEGIARQYESTVKPMYEMHIRAYVNYADLIVARGGKNALISDVLAYYINGGMVSRPS